MNTPSDPSIELASAVRSAIQDIAVGPDRGRDISAALALEVMQGILDSRVDEVQAAIFLIALRMKRETKDEFAGLLSALMASTEAATVKVPTLVCLADPFDGYVRHYSITPFIAPVLAACGLPALIHGVESVGPKFGATAHQVYRAFGINPLMSQEQAATAIETEGWAYLDQSLYNPKLYALNQLRNRIVKRSALTTLERLLCPLKAEHQTSLALGYVHKAYPEIYAAMAKVVGYDSAVLFKGVEGGLAPALNKPLRRFYCDTEMTWAEPAKQIIDTEPLVSGKTAAALVSSSGNDDTVEATLALGLKTLNGEKGVARESLSLAAGHILFSNRDDLTFMQAVEKVQQCLDNGSAWNAFNGLASS